MKLSCADMVITYRRRFRGNYLQWMRGRSLLGGRQLLFPDESLR